MSFWNKKYNAEISNASNLQLNSETWCDRDKHTLFENFTDFNDWIDGDDGIDIRAQYNLFNLSNPSKALFASDFEAYNQAFLEYRDNKLKEVLGEEFILENFGRIHWYERNLERFEQFQNSLIDGAVIPFIGAGLSVECGFPTWKEHLQQQAITSGLDEDHVSVLLDEGRYEDIIEEIESNGYQAAFIQEIKDVFSKTGTISETILRLTDLFNDCVITTNYDHILEQAFSTGKSNNIQIIDSLNALQAFEKNKTTIIHLHGDVKFPTRCILSKNQYDNAYGANCIDLTKPIPKLLRYFYLNSTLLFLGCSLNRDRTMEVFQAINNSLGDIERPSHFSFESMPANEKELADRNNYLLSFGITPIWFPDGSYEYIEQLLILAKNEMRYRKHMFQQKRLDSPLNSLQITKNILFSNKIKAIIKRYLTFNYH